jgi:phosphoglycerate dehydrogenase-like enzyme
LSESDFVVLAVPSTSETLHFIGEKELRAMKPTAYLVNIARGSIVDEPVLIRALQQKWIAGAGLDVYQSFPQPLPKDNPLWELDNVILTPHISGTREDYQKQATLQFCDNLRRYLKGEKLFNLVDKKKGY